MLSFIFCKALGLFVICSKKRFYFLELWAVFFFEKRDWDKFTSPGLCSVCRPVYWKIPFQKIWQSYFDLLYKCRVLLHAFLEAMFLLQLVVWSIFRRKIIGVKIFCFMDHEMCDSIISLVTTKKSLKKLKTFMCLERTS